VSGPRIAELLGSLGIETTYGRLQYSFTRRRIAWSDGWREALGAEAALRLGRVGCRGVDDWRIVAGWAVDAGLSFDRDYERGWDAWRVDLPSVPNHNGLNHHERALGSSMRALVKEIQSRHGIEDVGWSGTLDQCRRALWAADRVSIVGHALFCKYGQACICIEYASADASTSGHARRLIR